MKRLLSVAIFVSFWAATAVPALAGVSVKEIDKGGGITHLQVTNEYFDIEFFPEKGGQALSFKTRYSPENWIIPGESGMFLDRFVGQMWPGELAQSKYDYRIMERGPEKVVLEFQVMSKDNIMFYRKMTFEANSPVIRVNMGMVNQGTGSAVKGLWLQWIVYINGYKDREYTRFIRPWNHGLNEIQWDEQKKSLAGDDYVKTPYEGWTAAINTRTEEGVVWLMDYNWLKWLYNCPPPSTVEWVYDYAVIPKQEKWETEYDMILVKGYPGFCHASSNMIAGMQMGPSNAGDKSSDLVITHTLGRSMNGDIRDAKLTAVLRGVDSKEEYTLPELNAGTLSREPKNLTQTVKVNMNQRLVCNAVLTGTDAEGKPVKEEYSFYWPGINGEKFDLIAGTTATTYSRKPPRKVKVYARPKDLVYYRKPEPHMLELRGLHYRDFHISEAAVRGGILEIRGSYFTSSYSGNSLSYLPASFEEMFENDLVVMNDVDAACLTDFGQEALAEFVEAGGSLLVLGGPYAFGRGGYTDNRLADILPVEESENPFDLKENKPPALIKIAATAQILKGTRLNAPGYCYWLHAVKPKAGAGVEMTAGTEPFLICGRYGKGKITVVAGSMLGATTKKQPGFWETDEWVDTLSRVINWMLF